MIDFTVNIYGGGGGFIVVSFAAVGCFLGVSVFF